MMKRQRTAGFTLIEILAAMLVLSIALLGLASLHIVGVRTVGGAGSRVLATMLVDDLVERMRSNPQAVDAMTFNGFDSSTLNCTIAPTPYCESYHDGSSAQSAQSCTSAQLASFDMNTWFCGIVNGTERYNGATSLLPGAQATITCVDTPCKTSSPYDVTLNWTELEIESGGGTINQNITLRVVP